MNLRPAGPQTETLFQKNEGQRKTDTTMKSHLEECTLLQGKFHTGMVPSPQEGTQINQSYAKIQGIFAIIWQTRPCR